MTNAPAPGVAPTRLLDNSPVPLYLQLYEHLRAEILAGRRVAGEPLPPTRQLADLLGVSRNTVVLAYENLAAEGYTEARVGAGTFVRSTLPDLPPPRVPRVDREEVSATDVSRRASRASAVAPHFRARLSAPFQPGLPDLAAFPWPIWTRLVADTLRSIPARGWGYQDPAGYAPLREAIAAYLGESRGVDCDADQIVVVSGSQQGIDLAARVLLDPGESAVVEDPGYAGARAALWAAGVETLPVPVDDQGIRVGETAAWEQARLVCVTPSHQHPLGSTLSVGRRLRLLEWARRRSGWILEDDYDSEFRHTGRPLAALQSLDRSGRVLYLGTFSKVLFPALRLGYLVVPHALHDAFVAARYCSDRHSPLLEQIVVARFLAEGHFSRHLRRMRKLYRTRQEALLEAAERNLAGVLDLEPCPAGMHLVGWLDSSLDEQDLSRRAAEAGLDLPPLRRYCLDATPPPGVLLGYAGFDEEALERGVRRLADLARAPSPD